MTAFSYVRRLRSGRLYAGVTTDLDRRYLEHCAGRACRTPRSNPPEAVVYSEEHETFPSVREREPQVKRWSRAKKEALVAGDRGLLRHSAKSHGDREPHVN